MLILMMSLQYFGLLVNIQQQIADIVNEYECI